MLSSLTVPVSGDYAELQKWMAETLAALDTRVDTGLLTWETSLSERKSLVASYNLRRDKMDRMRVKDRQLFFHQPALEKLVKEEIMPFLMAVQKGEDQPLMEKLKTTNRQMHDAILEEYRQRGKMDPSLLKPIQRFAAAYRFFNDYLLQEAQLFIVMLNGRGVGDYYLALAKVLTSHEWPIDSDTTITFHEIEIFFPAMFREWQTGTFDRNLGSWVDSTASWWWSYGLFAQHAGRIKRNSTEFTAEYVQRYKSVDGLSRAVMRTAMYEEVKHQINFYHRIFGYGGSEDQHGNRLKFLKDRLLPGGYFDLKKVAENEELQVALQVEELNAKLTAIAFSHDPVLDIVLHDQTWQMAQEGSEAATTTNVLAGMLYNAPVKRVSRSDLRAMVALDKNTVRKMAWSALKRTFREDLDQNPFCTLDQAGNLVPKYNTHPLFRQWAKSVD